MGQSKISITTTGKSIQDLEEIERRALLSNCELTFDCSSSEAPHRQSDEYHSLNERFATEIKAKIDNLSINVPILDTSKEARIDELIKDINALQPDKVTLLRLMPVGKMNPEEYPADYNPKSVIDKFKKDINSDIEVHLQCALRGKFGDKDYSCNMLKEKIGIDCAGNVFACAWAAYLKAEKEKNPFYLGNLLDNTLTEILDSNKAKDLLYRMEKQNNKHCCLFSYIKSPKNDPFDLKDPFFSE